MLRLRKASKKAAVEGVLNWVSLKSHVEYGKMWYSTAHHRSGPATGRDLVLGVHDPLQLT